MERKNQDQRTPSTGRWMVATNGCSFCKCMPTWIPNCALTVSGRSICPRNTSGWIPVPTHRSVAASTSEQRQMGVHVKCAHMHTWHSLE